MESFLIQYEVARVDTDEIYVKSTVKNWRFILHEPEHAEDTQVKVVQDVIDNIEHIILSEFLVIFQK